MTFWIAVVIALAGATAFVGEVGGAFRDTDVAQAGIPPVSAVSGPTQSIQPAGQQACLADTLIGRLRKDHAPARSAPSTSARVIKTFDRTSALGAPQVFVIQRQVFADDGTPWYRVRLPIRPNGTHGFIPVDALSVSKTSYRLELRRRTFTLRLFKGCELLKTYRVGIGTGKTPTPVGDFYLVSLLKLPDPNTIYGTYAYGLSGFSDILKTWAFGGIIGVHGTNDPSSIGRRSSHGCIRMRNRDVDQLVKILPLGTPIEIK